MPVLAAFYGMVSSCCGTLSLYGGMASLGCVMVTSCDGSENYSQISKPSKEAGKFFKVMDPDGGNGNVQTQIVSKGNSPSLFKCIIFLFFDISSMVMGLSPK